VFSHPCPHRDFLQAFCTNSSNHPATFIVGGQSKENPPACAFFEYSNVRNYFMWLHHHYCLQYPIPKFQPIVVSNFGIIALYNRKSKEIDLYNNYSKNKLQVLAFVTITSVCSVLHSVGILLCNGI